MKNVEVCFNNDEFNETCTTVSNLQRLGDETVSLDVFEETNDTYTYDVSISHETQDDLSDSSSGTVTIAATPTGEPAEDREEKNQGTSSLSANVSISSNEDLGNLSEGDLFSVNELSVTNDGDNVLNVSITGVRGGNVNDVFYRVLGTSGEDRTYDSTEFTDGGSIKALVEDVNFSEGVAKTNATPDYPLDENGATYLKINASAVNSSATAQDRVNLNFTEPTSTGGTSTTS
jgi:hypothetical protein